MMFHNFACFLFSSWWYTDPETFEKFTPSSKFPPLWCYEFGKLALHWPRNTCLQWCYLDIYENNKYIDFAKLDVAHNCTISLCYLGSADNQSRDPMTTNKDCRVGQLSTCNNVVFCNKRNQIDPAKLDYSRFFWQQKESKLSQLSEFEQKWLLEL